MSASFLLGRQGEELATTFYRRRGFKVVDRNYRCPAGEIDLVVRRRRLVVFCEVKARRTNRWGEPSEAVDYRKQARLKRLAGHWLAGRAPGRVQIRFDVISIIFDPAGVHITHLKDAF